MPRTAVAPALHALLEHVVDYAGLFPPAGRSMHDAVSEYAAHRSSAHAWMLGRFVVPVARLEELAAAAETAQDVWPLSVLVSADPPGDAATLARWSRGKRERFMVESVELAATSVEATAWALSPLESSFERYVEIPLEPDPAPLLEAVKNAGARAKVRTGGLRTEAFPAARLLARFIVACARTDVPFKATAGLHHPVRGEQPLTYEPDAPSATMFGFLNVFVAAALAHSGADLVAVEQVLDERDATAFSFRDDGLRWRERTVDLARLRESRRMVALSFGSCSFQEPVDDLQRLGLL